MSDGIIDLTRYLERGSAEGPPARGAFALWGAEGESSRFALPLWRAIYLASGERGGLVWREEADPGRTRPFVVLDLAQDPARTDFGAGMPAVDDCDAAPRLFEEDPSGLCVYLGRRSGRLWYLVVDGVRRDAALGADEREDVLFLAGECAGLLFLRDFDRELPGSSADGVSPAPSDA